MNICRKWDRVETQCGMHDWDILAPRLWVYKTIDPFRDDVCDLRGYIILVTAESLFGGDKDSTLLYRPIGGCEHLLELSGKLLYVDLRETWNIIESRMAATADSVEKSNFYTQWDVLGRYHQVEAYMDRLLYSLYVLEWMANKITPKHPYDRPTWPENEFTARGEE